MNFLFNHWDVYQYIFTGLAILIWYFIKRKYDNKDALLKSKQDLFYNHKIQAIDEFIKAYTSLENFYWQVPYFDVASRIIKPKELDDMHMPIFNRVTASYYSLILFLSKSEMNNFSELRDEIYKVKRALGQLYFTKEEIENNIIPTNEYSYSTSALMKKSEEILNKIADEFKQYYSI